MEVLHTLCAAAAAVSIVALIAWGATSCSQQDRDLREACIKAGGSVITAGMNGDFHCLRIGSSAGDR